MNTPVTEQQLRDAAAGTTMQAYEKQHLAQLRDGLAECTVLLKKDGKFPLEGPCSIAAYGSGVRRTVKGGTGSGEVNSRCFVTVEQGLLDAGFTVTTGPWLDAYDDIYLRAQEQFIRDVKKRARAKRTLALLEGMGAVMPQPEYTLPLDADGDAAIYVLSRNSGEGNDRTVTPGDFLLTETEQRDILALNKKYNRFMLVLNVGGPVDLTPVLEVGNILVLSQLGVETGRALADILTGAAVPSGKLATTWAAASGYPDVGSFADVNDTWYKEGIYVGYRWFDAAGRKPLFPFGHGLSYTQFALGGQSVQVQGSRVTVTATVTNTGPHPGKEVVQVYVSCPAGRLDKPVKDLAAFGKTGHLAPGESEQLTVAFDLADCASYDEATAAYLLEQGRYIVLCGTGSANAAPLAALALDGDVVVKQVKNLLGDAGFADWKNPTAREAADLPVIPVSVAVFAAETVDYALPPISEAAVDALTDRELALMNTGAFDPKGGITSFVGSAAKTVAGAAGESCGLFAAKGIPAMVMADGPAGLRISPQYYRDQKGIHTYGPAMPQSMLQFMPKLLAPLLGGTPRLPKGARLQEQYCTAIPIGTALAQSWNTDYARLCGDVVGSELERFGVHLWLAPALNIHRTALCGRNFEYFSEDPVLSGLMAAAITGGVQAHPGRGVTLKHYAANNQETNRYASNSHVSERAMREIYLKGFALAIRHAAPKAVMTSYNLLNGVHTSESRALCTDILRREFGFDGVCMTDWVVAAMPPLKGSLYGFPDPALVAAAGGDLFMPGCRSDCSRICAGLKNGLVTRQQLRVNAARVCRLAKALTQAK